METLGVMPVDPAERSELEVVDRLPGSPARTPDELGLVERVDALGEGIDAPICQELIMQPLKEQFWHGNLPSLDHRFLER